MSYLKRITEVSREIGVSSTTIRRWTRRGLVPVSRSPGGRWFWTREQVEAIKTTMGIEQAGSRGKAVR
jgi:DNA-binding transcriptional MerR regulator